jgi:hypothetical protein
VQANFLDFHFSEVVLFQPKETPLGCSSAGDLSPCGSSPKWYWTPTQKDCLLGSPPEYRYSPCLAWSACRPYSLNWKSGRVWKRIPATTAFSPAFIPEVSASRMICADVTSNYWLASSASDEWIWS